MLTERNAGGKDGHWFVMCETRRQGDSHGQAKRRGRLGVVDKEGTCTLQARSITRALSAIKAEQRGPGDGGREANPSSSAQ